MKHVGLASLAGLCCALVVVTGCQTGGSSGSTRGRATGGSDLNNPGTWAYDGCRAAVLARVQRDHPHVRAIQFVGHVSEEKETDSRSVLFGEGKFPKDGDNVHFSFRCEVNRDTKKVGQAKYDKT